MESAIITWNNYEKMIMSRCWSFHYSTGMEFEELLSLAREKFMKIYNRYSDRKKTEFGKILFISINNCLKDKTHERKFTELPEWFNPSARDPEKMWYEDFVEVLSTEAKEAVDMILEKGLTTRTECSDMMLNELDYNYPTVWKCMREIKSILKNL